MDILPKDSVVMHPLPRVDEVRLTPLIDLSGNHNLLLICCIVSSELLLQLVQASLYKFDPCEVLRAYMRRKVRHANADHN